MNFIYRCEHRRWTNSKLSFTQKHFAIVTFKIINHMWPDQAVGRIAVEIQPVFTHSGLRSQRVD